MSRRLCALLYGFSRKSIASRIANHVGASDWGLETLGLQRLPPSLGKPQIPLGPCKMPTKASVGQVCTLPWNFRPDRKLLLQRTSHVHPLYPNVGVGLEIVETAAGVRASKHADFAAA